MPSTLRRIQGLAALTAVAAVAAVGAAPAWGAAGELDLSFSGDGRVTTSFGGRDVATGVAIDADGRIVVAGANYDGKGTSPDFVIARYGDDGTLDTSFGGDGRIRTDFGGREVAHSVAIDLDGKIVVSGEGYRPFSGNDFVVARYNDDGTRDSSFSGDGRIRTSFAGTRGADAAYGLGIDSQGRIVVGGTTTVTEALTGRDFAVVRYLPDGSLDPSFSGDGKVQTPIAPGPDAYDTIHALAIDSQDRIVAAGHTIPPLPLGSQFGEYAVARYTTGGSLDSSFSGDGKLTLSFPGTDYDSGRAVAVDSQDRVIPAGIGWYEGDGYYDFQLARYDVNGNLDDSFSGDGLVRSPYGDDGSRWAHDVLGDVGIDSQGRIVAAGESDYPYENSRGVDFAVARYSPDGILDQSFGPGGWVKTSFDDRNATDSIQEIAIDSQDRIVAVGMAHRTSDFAVARYLGN